MGAANQERGEPGNEVQVWESQPCNSDPSHAAEARPREGGHFGLRKMDRDLKWVKGRSRAGASEPGVCKGQPWKSGDSTGMSPKF